MLEHSLSSRSHSAVADQIALDLQDTLDVNRKISAGIMDAWGMLVELPNLIKKDLPPMMILKSVQIVVSVYLFCKH